MQKIQSTAEKRRRAQKLDYYEYYINKNVLIILKNNFLKIVSTLPKQCIKCLGIFGFFTRVYTHKVIS